MRFELLAIAMSIAVGVSPETAQGQAAKATLMTRWAKDVSADNVHPEYPRPQMVRKQWQNLNGHWDYAVRPKAEDRPEKFDGQILVPFPIESALSGVTKRVSDRERLWYKRSFIVPRAWLAGRVLLHFGAVDWDATVWMNGHKLGSHRGGYDPFSLDITDALTAEGPQELVVAVWDPTDKGYQPRGKQVQRPESIWYTPTTGIWQTVWIEPVPKGAYIASLRITPDVSKSTVRVEITGPNISPQHKVLANVGVGGGKFAYSDSRTAQQSPVEVKIDNPRHWSPDDPFLYDVTVALLDENFVMLDNVQSYVGMRSISLGKDQHGTTRIMLNGQPVFQFGPLDQGFWPDGLYTAPTDAALKYDIEMTKKLGFNMARKHVKVEPDRWYYWCDKLGLLVWQDMPSGDAYVAPGRGEIRRAKESTENYEREWKAIIDARYNHPSIVMWVPFNEGWGQFETARIVEMTKKHDPSRLVNCASGWNDYPVGDVHDIHVYPGPGSPQPEERRAAVLGEFGGLGLPVRGHTWQDEKNWGYRSFSDQASLTEAYVGLLNKLHPLIGSPGLSAAVYTQTTDVEIEVNGLMTYDRAMVKLDEPRIAAANRRMYEPPPRLGTVVPTSQQPGVSWRYTTTKPAEGWTGEKFDAKAWQTGEGGFGTKETPGTSVRTTWNTPDIWLRREIILPDRKLGELLLLVHHDEDVEVYLNGVLAAEAKGFTTGYELLPLTGVGHKAGRPGVNLLAVHCKQTRGGQYIDVGIVELERGAEKLQAAAPANQWRSLFDGKKLGAWKSTEFGGQGEVTVEDGQIILPPGAELTGVTWTGELPKVNYELALEAMRIDGGDFFCGLTFPVGEDPCSLIVGGWGGGVVGLSSIDGHDASMNDTTQFRSFKSGRWYAVKVRVTKSKIEAWLDDEKIVDQDTTSKKISIRPEVELSKPLGVASYATRAALRNIRVRALATD